MALDHDVKLDLDDIARRTKMPPTSATPGLKEDIASQNKNNAGTSR